MSQASTVDNFQVIESLKAVERAVESKMSGMGTELAGIRNSMGQIAEAITRLAVLEEKHQGIVTIVNKVVDKVDALEDRQAKNEMHRELVLQFVEEVKKLGAAIGQMQLDQASMRGQAKGASKVVQVMWTVMGSGVLAIAAALLKIAFASGSLG